MSESRVLKAASIFGEVKPRRSVPSTSSGPGKRNGNTTQQKAPAALASEAPSQALATATLFGNVNNPHFKSQGVAGQPTKTRDAKLRIRNSTRGTNDAAVRQKASVFGVGLRPTHLPPARQASLAEANEEAADARGAEPEPPAGAADARGSQGGAPLRSPPARFEPPQESADSMVARHRASVADYVKSMSTGTFVPPPSKTVLNASGSVPVLAKQSSQQSHLNLEVPSEAETTPTAGGEDGEDGVVLRRGGSFASAKRDSVVSIYEGFPDEPEAMAPIQVCQLRRGVAGPGGVRGWVVVVKGACVRVCVRA